MNKKELIRHSKQELEVMRYYGFKEDRKNLDLTSKEGIYEQVRSIGYSKVNTDLDLRCNGYISIKFEDGKSIDEMEVFQERRSLKENKLKFGSEVIAKEGKTDAA